MTADFAYIISNLSSATDEDNEIKISPETIIETPTDSIENVKIPENASGIVLFKNEIAGRDGFDEPIVEKFDPKNIKQYIITSEEFISLPKLYSRFSIAKDLTDGIVGAYLLRDGTLFLVTEKMKGALTPILSRDINENGFANQKQK